MSLTLTNRPHILAAVYYFMQYLKDPSPDIHYPFDFLWLLPLILEWITVTNPYNSTIIGCSCVPHFPWGLFQGWVNCSPWTLYEHSTPEILQQLAHFSYQKNIVSGNKKESFFWTKGRSKCQFGWPTTKFPKQKFLFVLFVITAVTLYKASPTKAFPITSPLTDLQGPTN